MILFLINKLLEKNITESQNRRNFDGSRALFVICTRVLTLHWCYMKNSLVFGLLYVCMNFSYTLLQLQQKITFSPRDFHCTRQALVMRNWNITLLYFVYFFPEG